MGETFIRGNFRSISLLPSHSKLYERVLSQQIYPVWFLISPIYFLIWVQSCANIVQTQSQFLDLQQTYKYSNRKRAPPFFGQCFIISSLHAPRQLFHKIYTSVKVYELGFQKSFFFHICCSIENVSSLVGASL